MTEIDLPRLIERTRRIPRLDPATAGGNGAVVARQLIAVLATAGWTCSRDVVDNLTAAPAGEAMDRAVVVIAAARHLVGDHVRHNAYFRDFPSGVPDTVEFWRECLNHAVAHGEVTVPPRRGLLDLLRLPRYGRYQHPFEDLAAAHDELIASAGDRISILHLGGTVAEEAGRLLGELAGSATPLTPADRDLLRDLVVCVGDNAIGDNAIGDTAIGDVPVRENRAIIDAARLGENLPPALAGTVTDVLRVAAAASGADVTLTDPPRFTSLRRRQRRLLLTALDAIVAESPRALRDVPARAEAWKRLGERLHPHEFPGLPHAAQVFEVARGERRVGSLISAAEAVAPTDPAAAARILAAAPGTLARWTDRLLRACAPGSAEQAAVLDAFTTAAPGMSGRVLLSLREHLDNRAAPSGRRLFVNRQGRAHAEPDQRRPLDPDAVATVRDVVDAEIAGRLPAAERLIIDPAVLDVALPLSGKATADGFGVLPRGTSSALPTGDTLRFFVYWRQAARRTDFDLSLVLLDEQFQEAGQVSWTGLRSAGIVHSGDITESPDGATEFIDVPLSDTRARYLVPQVNVYAGEGFDEVAESLFGWMVRDRAQAGMPFDPRTVRALSALRGSGRVALPAVFHRDDHGWRVTWLHLNLRGSPHFNMLEGNRVSAAELTRSLLDRRYLTVRYLADMLAAKAASVGSPADLPTVGGPVMFIGMERVDGLPPGSTVITLENLNALVPG